MTTATAQSRYTPSHTQMGLPVVLGVSAVVLAAGLVLFGWALDIEGVKSVVPSLPRMMPNTALGLLPAAASLWLLRVERPNYPPKSRASK